MVNFKQYRRKQIAELREVTDYETMCTGEDMMKEFSISVSSEDSKAGSPKDGDMIARNPKNHDDQWLVAAEYFNDNFEEVI